MSNVREIRELRRLIDAATVGVLAVKVKKIEVFYEIVGATEQCELKISGNVAVAMTKPRIVIEYYDDSKQLNKVI